MIRFKRALAPLQGALQQFLAGSGLKAHVFRGGTWLGFGGACEQLLKFARNIALTRLLAPEAFGIMAIIYSTGYVVDSFAQIGMKEAIIQNPKGHEASYSNSAWWLGFLRGLAIYALMFAAAPWVGTFYGHSEISPLMRIALLGIVFTGAQSPKAFVALKEMQFKKWTIIQVSSGLAGSVIVVALALVIRSVWALAIGYAIENLLRCAISYWLCPFRPRTTIDRDSAKSLLTFSRGVFGLSFLYLIFSRTDVFVLGKLRAASELGIYTMAVYLVQVPASFLAGVISQTLMPSFARIQDDCRRVNTILVRVSTILFILGIPVLMFFILSSHGILKLMYGSSYVAASSTLSVAALVGLLNVLNNVITAAFFAFGRPQFHRRCVLISALLMLTMIYPAVQRFGMLGGQISALVALVAGFASQLVRIERLTRLDLFQYSRSLPLTIGASGIVLSLFLGLRWIWPLSDPMANLTFGALAFAITFAIVGRQLVRQLV